MPLTSEPITPPWRWMSRQSALTHDAHGHNVSDMEHATVSTGRESPLSLRAKASRLKSHELPRVRQLRRLTSQDECDTVNRRVTNFICPSVGPLTGIFPRAPFFTPTQLERKAIDSVKRNPTGFPVSSHYGTLTRRIITREFSSRDHKRP